MPLGKYELVPTLKTKEELADYIRSLGRKIVEGADQISTDPSSIHALEITMKIEAGCAPAVEWKYEKVIFAGKEEENGR